MSPVRGREPQSSEVAEPFWEATRQQRLVIQFCRDCARPVHYPREICPFCLGGDLEFRPVSGRGRIYARIVMHDPETYVVALVELDEGARMMTNIVGDITGAAVDAPVAVTWEPLEDGRHLPVFEVQP